MCGQCHGRRGQFSDDDVHGRPLGDTHRVALLDDRLYYPDGQVRDEVYEYGSFLEVAARLVPETARYGYVYAVGLSGTGRPKQAIEVLERVLARHPYDRDTLSALVAYAREQSRPRQALAYARRLAEIEPANVEVRQLVERLEAEAAR